MAETQENQVAPYPDESPRAGKKLERAAKRRERETRAKRIILAGSLASFLGFFGLSMAAEPFTSIQTADAQAPAVTAGHHDDDEGHGSAFVNGQPQIRTRTS